MGAGRQAVQSAGAAVAQTVTATQGSGSDVEVTRYRVTKSCPVSLTGWTGTFAVGHVIRQQDYAPRDWTALLQVRDRLGLELAEPAAGG